MKGNAERNKMMVNLLKLALQFLFHWCFRDAGHFGQLWADTTKVPPQNHGKNRVKATWFLLKVLNLIQRTYVLFVIFLLPRIEELRTFIGLTNDYRHFVKGFTHIASPVSLRNFVHHGAP